MTPTTRAKTDRALEDEARVLLEQNASAGIALLAGRAIMFARHEEGELPCLCLKCLEPALDRAESRGLQFVRDFVVSRHRVFFYWVPAELLPDAKQVRASMRGRVKQRLDELRLKIDEPRAGIPARTGPPRINPFTGKLIQ